MRFLFFLIQYDTIVVKPLVENKNIIEQLTPTLSILGTIIGVLLGYYLGFAKERRLEKKRLQKISEHLIFISKKLLNSCKIQITHIGKFRVEFNKEKIADSNIVFDPNFNSDFYSAISDKDVYDILLLKNLNNVELSEMFDEYIYCKRVISQLEKQLVYDMNQFRDKSNEFFERMRIKDKEVVSSLNRLLQKSNDKPDMTIKFPRLASMLHRRFNNNYDTTDIYQRNKHFDSILMKLAFRYNNLEIIEVLPEKISLFNSYELLKRTFERVYMDFEEHLNEVTIQLKSFIKEFEDC